MQRDPNKQTRPILLRRDADYGSEQAGAADTGSCNPDRGPLMDPQVVSSMFDFEPINLGRLIIDCGI